jgi:hypothetical protein
MATVSAAVTILQLKSGLIPWYQGKVMAKNRWFEVDKNGLSKLLERRGKSFVLFELIQNAWDQNVTTVEVSFELIKGRHAATIIVADDDPNGFENLAHAFTLFAETTKKKDPTKRGRFNVGEKLVLACCEEAEVLTTSGGVKFTRDGDRKSLHKGTEKGSVFSGIVKMTKSQFQEARKSVDKLIPPSGIVTKFRFGQKRVIYDPSDIEANKRAVSEGYNVIHGSQLSKAEWENVRRTGTTLPAGQVTPTRPDKVVKATEVQPTDQMKRVIEFSKTVAEKLMAVNLRVTILEGESIIGADYGSSGSTGHLRYNLTSLGHSFFDDFPSNQERVLALLIHEFGHHYSGDHLSAEYHEALSDLGAKLTLMAINEPEVFTDV